MTAFINKMLIKKKDLASCILLEDMPANVAKLTAPLLASSDNSLYLCMTANKYNTVCSVAEGLVLLLKTYWVLDLHYPKEAKNVFKFLLVVCGGGDLNSLSKAQKSLMTSATQP